MVKRPKINLIVLSLAAMGGWPLSVSAQQAPSPAATTRTVEPPPMDGKTQAVQTMEKKELIVKDAPPPPEIEKNTDGKDWSAGGSVQVKTADNGIRYASGGVGAGERDELRAMSDQFNLQVMSAMQGGGEYLADVGIKIMDSKGATVLSATSKGPYFLAQLPPGSYTVEVSAKDQSQKQAAQVGKSQAQLNFYWR